jgi:serine/threonine-protein kinase
LIALALSAASGVAHAEGRDPAAAQALFDEAKKLTAQGKYPEACAKLAESNRLDPGIGTQFHLADYQEKSGKIASAWANFLEVASQARASGQGDREKAAIKRAGQLEARLPKLRIDVPEANRVPGLEIRRDGALVGSAQWGSPVPVDPGEHELVATAPGKRTLSQKVRAEVGKTNTLVLPPLEAEPASATQAAEPPQGFVMAEAKAGSTQPSPASSDSSPKADSGADSGGTNPLVYVLAGAGVVGVGVGTVFALMANSTNDDSMADCRPEDPNRCNARGVDARDKAQTQGNIATVGFIAGGAALAGAGALFLFGGKGSSETSSTAIRPSAEIGPGRAGVYVRGKF